MGKIDKIRGLPSILSLFHHTFTKFNDTGVRSMTVIFFLSYDTLNYFEIAFDLKT